MTDDPQIRQKTLKQLKRETPNEHQVRARLLAAEQAPDYEAAIISASLLEFMLTQIIKTRFVPLSNDRLAALFNDPHSPLSSFSNKIKVAHALGAISDQTRSDLERINAIRNHFAHHKDVVRFDDEIISTECKRLSVSAEQFRIALAPPITAKQSYVRTCTIAAVVISNIVTSIEAGVPHSEIHPIQLC